MNVVPIHAPTMDPGLPEPRGPGLQLDTYHHMDDRVAYFQSLARYLKPDGRVAILDFHPHGFFSVFWVMVLQLRSGARWNRPGTDGPRTST